MADIKEVVMSAIKSVLSDKEKLEDVIEKFVKKGDLNTAQGKVLGEELLGKLGSLSQDSDGILGKLGGLGDLLGGISGISDRLGDIDLDGIVKKLMALKDQK